MNGPDAPLESMSVLEECGLDDIAQNDAPTITVPVGRDFVAIPVGHPAPLDCDEEKGGSQPDEKHAGDDLETKQTLAPSSASRRSDPCDLTQPSEFARIRNDPLRPQPRPTQNLGTVDLDIKDCDPAPEGSTEDLLPLWFKEHSLVPGDLVATKASVTDLISRIHRRANVLRTLPSLDLWSDHLRRCWENATSSFAPYIHQAITLPSNSTGFLKMLLRLQELPTLALSPHMKDTAPESEGRSNLTAKLKKVESLTLQDRVNAATKVLFSHGIAPATEELFQRLQKLHPANKEPIPRLRTGFEQFYLDPQDVEKALSERCTEAWHSCDPFGWNTSLLHLVREAPDGENSPAFFRGYSALVSQLISADVSDLGSFVVSGGLMFGLNKESEEKRVERENQGESPKERPINQGSLILKLVFDLALHSPGAIGALADCSPIQMGVGAKRGMELIGLYDKGYAIVKLDASNGFQEITRASMHRAVQKRCPSLLKLFQKFYTKDSACFFDLPDEVKLISSTEGARIGCKLGSFVFALTLQDLYEQIAGHLATSKDGSCIKAATDDVIMIIKADPDHKKDLENKIKKMCSLLRTGGRKLGVSFDNDKAQCLLPPGWNQDDIQLPGLKIYSNLAPSIVNQGMEVVGVPVGSPIYCLGFIDKTLDKIVHNCESLIKLHPQCATKLLRESVCTAPGYMPP